MASTNLFVTGILFFSFCLGINGHHTNILLPSLSEDTHKALASIADLPPHCTVGLEQHIMAGEVKAVAEFVGCNFYVIAIETAEVLLDTIFSVFQAWSSYPALKNDLVAVSECFKESGAKNVSLCLVAELPGTVGALTSMVQDVENYIGEMKMIIPLLVKNVEECKSSTVGAHQLFLNQVVEKAQTC